MCAYTHGDDGAAELGRWRWRSMCLLWLTSEALMVGKLQVDAGRGNGVRCNVLKKFVRLGWWWGIKGAPPASPPPPPL